jgi:hypothetical protein
MVRSVLVFALGMIGLSAGTDSSIPGYDGDMATEIQGIPMPTLKD